MVNILLSTILHLELEISQNAIVIVVFRVLDYWTGSSLKMQTSPRDPRKRLGKGAHFYEAGIFIVMCKV